MNIQKKPLPSSNYSRGWTRTPWVIVLHYTAGYTNKQCWEVLKNRGISVHNCIERDGRIFEYVSDKNRAWHAGYGSWGGRNNMNHHSLGIEMVNFGWGEGEFEGKSPHSVFRWDKRYPDDPEVLPDASGSEWYRDESYKNSSGKTRTVRCITKQAMASYHDHRTEMNDKLWTIYPKEQIKSTAWLVSQWMKRYNIIPENVVGHEHVSPHRKLDPGPSFPWIDFEKEIRSIVSCEAPHLLRNDFNPTGRIKAVQSHCSRMGIAVGDIDGMWGPKTQAATEKAFELYADTYNLGRPDIGPDNCYAIANALRRVPGFDPGRI